MPKRIKSLTPAQLKASKKTLEQLIQEAESLPTPVIRSEESMFPVICILKDKKMMFWTEIAKWFYENTEFYRAPTFWKKLYTEGKEKTPATTLP